MKEIILCLKFLQLVAEEILDYLMNWLGLKNVETPKVLIIPHSQRNEENGEQKSFETAKGYFHNTTAFEQYKKKNFNKWFRVLLSSDLTNNQKVSEYISWADICYVPLEIH